MLICPKCGCSIIRVVTTLTIIENGKGKEVDLLECTNCGHKEKEVGN